MNIRIATLEKKTTLPFEYTPSLITKKEASKWIVMGHFDFLSMSTLNMENSFFLCLRVLKSTLAEVSIPDSVYYSLARVLLPEILKDLETEKSQRTEKESKTDLKLQTAV